MKLVVVTSASALLLAIPSFAWAQSAPAQQPDSCPPGSWFCAPPQRRAAGPRGQARVAAASGSGRRAGPAAAPSWRGRRGRRRGAGAARRLRRRWSSISRRAPMMVERPENPPPYEYRPPPRHYISPPREWGLNLHLEGAALGDGTHHDASMGGLGAGLRYKPSRYFGLEWDIDFYGGHGYVGDQRHETATSFNALLFLNPQSRAQLYLLAGFGWAWAHSENDPNDPVYSQGADVRLHVLRRPGGHRPRAAPHARARVQHRLPGLHPQPHRRPVAVHGRVHELAGSADEHRGRRSAHRRHDALLLIASRFAGSSPLGSFEHSRSPRYGSSAIRSILGLSEAKAPGTYRTPKKVSPEFPDPAS